MSKKRFALHIKAINKSN